MGIYIKALRWVLPLLSFASFAASRGDLRLVDAVKNGDTETVHFLLNQQVDVNSPDHDGATALLWAVHWNDLETAELLIGSGANVNAANDYGITPLWEACNNASAPIVERLLKAGANPDTRLLRSGETPLMRCARTGNADAVKALLARSADVNVKELQKDQTALMWALAERHPEVARVLIEHGADIHGRSKGGITPLLFAARDGDIASARLLLEKGADVNESAPGGFSVLLMATDSGREEFAKFLLDKGANPNAADANGFTALHYSLRKGISILQFVSNFSSNYDEPHAYLLRPNMTGLAKALLDHGANPNARVVRGTQFASKIGAGDWPQLGLAGATPFLLAAATGDLAVMRMLLDKGADSNLATNDGVTPFLAAAGLGRASTEVRTKEEERQYVEVLKLLLDLGADINAANHDGYTAVHAAASTGGNEIVQFLVDNGARLDVMDKWGQTPLSIAEGDPNRLAEDRRRSGQPSTANLIRKLGGDPLAHGSDLASENANH